MSYMVMEDERVRTTQEITWQGMVYEVDAQAAYRDGGLVRLPDGQLLRVSLWNSSAIPPQIMALDRARFHDAKLRA